MRGWQKGGNHRCHQEAVGAKGDAWLVTKRREIVDAG